MFGVLRNLGASHEQLKKVLLYHYRSSDSDCFIIVVLSFICFITQRIPSLFCSWQRIHAFRLPLGPVGQLFMGLFYFSIPCVIGYNMWIYQTGLANERVKVFEKEMAISTGVKEQNAQLQLSLNDIKRP